MTESHVVVPLSMVRERLAEIDPNEMRIKLTAGELALLNDTAKRTGQAAHVLLHRFMREGLARMNRA